MSVCGRYRDPQQMAAGARKGVRSDSVVCPLRVKERPSGRLAIRSRMRRKADVRPERQLNVTADG